jgi:hypothetical protein
MVDRDAPGNKGGRLVVRRHFATIQPMMRLTLQTFVLMLFAAPALIAQGATAPRPGLTFAFEIRAQVGMPLEMGQVPQGRRRIIQILGGTFSGPGIRGRILPGGADWQIVRADGFTELDTRYTLETDKGELIYVQNKGVRSAAPDVMKKLLAGETVDPSLVYFRTVPIFETAAPALQQLARSVYIGIGERYPSEVVVRFWRVE